MYKSLKVFLLIMVLMILIVTPNQTVFAKGNKPFTFVWMSDTQYYSLHYPYIFDQMTQWIVDNEREQSLKYVIHTGDVVDHMNNEFEWIQADLAMKKLDQANIPYGVLAGNHDIGHKKLNYKKFGEYFGTERFQQHKQFRGAHKNNEAHYDIIQASGHKFLIVYLGFGWNTDTLTWAQSIIKEHPEHTTILATHRYLQVDGKRSSDGEQLFNELVVPNPSVQLVLSGHFHGTAQRFDRLDDDNDGVNERTVVQILSDYQGYEKGGNGFMRLITFQPLTSSATISTYSPFTKEAFIEDADFHHAPMTFSFPIDF